MSRISQAFAQGKALIPFLTCGDPDLETTRAAVLALAQAGAGMIQLGIPFSDPTAEGPVLQAASAMNAGTAMPMSWHSTAAPPTDGAMRPAI